MAISWEFKITVLDYDLRHVSVTGTRTDSDNPADPRAYTVAPRHIGTTAQNVAVLNEIKALRTADVALDAKKAAFAPTITALEDAAKNSLEAWET